MQNPAFNMHLSILKTTSYAKKETIWTILIFPQYHSVLSECNEDIIYFSVKQFCSSVTARYFQHWHFINVPGLTVKILNLRRHWTPESSHSFSITHSKSTVLLMYHSFLIKICFQLYFTKVTAVTYVKLLLLVQVVNKRTADVKRIWLCAHVMKNAAILLLKCVHLWL